jgi:hypothetical protein
MWHLLSTASLTALCRHENWIIDSGCRGFIGPYPSAPLDEWVIQLSGHRSVRDSCDKAGFGHTPAVTPGPAGPGRPSFPESCYETVTEEMVTGCTGAPSLPDVVPRAAMPVTTSKPSPTVPNTV